MKKYGDILKKVELFKGIEDLEGLLSCLDGRLRDYKKGEIILMSGERVEALGIVISGAIELVKEDYYGNRNILAHFKEADIFAEAFVFSGEKSPLTVYAREDSSIFFIKGDRFLSPCSKVCSHHRDLIFNMMEILSRKNLILNNKIEHLGQKTTRDKLLSYLSDQAKKSGSREFEISFNRQELADYLSVNRSAMSVELSNLAEDGLIEYDRNHFRLLEEEE